MSGVSGTSSPAALTTWKSLQLERILICPFSACLLTANPSPRQINAQPLLNNIFAPFQLLNYLSSITPHLQLDAEDEPVGEEIPLCVVVMSDDNCLVLGSAKAVDLLQCMRENISPRLLRF